VRNNLLGAAKVRKSGFVSKFWVRDKIWTVIGKACDVFGGKVDIAPPKQD
jgi:hypothetical protein